MDEEDVSALLTTNAYKYPQPLCYPRYQQGWTKTSENLSEETRGVVNEALQALVDAKEEERVEDDDLEELLRWTNSLDYEE